MRTVITTPDGPVLRDVAEPTRADHEALVAVRAFSVNRGELALLAARPNGWRPGQDVAGVIVEPSRDGSGPAAGVRITAQVEQGGWAERIAVPTDRLAALPDAVTVEQGAALPLAGLTALRTLRLGGALIGRRVLVTGANGGVGRYQVQLAALAGAHVTAVGTASDLTALGAAEVVKAVADAAPDQHLITESVGGESLTAALDRIAPGGTIVVFGASSGQKAALNVYDFLGHEGARLVSYLSYAHPEPPGPDLAVLVDLVASGRLRTTLGRVADWTALPEVLADLEHRAFAGKAVLTIPA
jgi:NADPH:quinone reductase-like Zn-dependent oxidoreductase